MTNRERKLTLDSIDYDKALSNANESEEAFLETLTQFEITSCNESLLKLSKLYYFRNWSEMLREVLVFKGGGMYDLNLCLFFPHLVYFFWVDKSEPQNLLTPVKN